MIKPIHFDQAIALVAANVSALGNEVVPLAEAAGRVLAAPVIARSDSPRRPVSAMDGYAVCDATTRPGMSLRVIGESRAGVGFTGTVGPGETVRIFTGAPLPTGTDRCIVQESAMRDGDTACFAEGYGPGWHVRAAGSDFGAGDLLLDSGTLLTPQAMVTAAAADLAELTVAVRARVGIIGTGDELSPPGMAFERADTIADSVTFGVAAMVANAGGMVVARTTAVDDLPSLEAQAAEFLATADLVIVIGGASVGDRDFAKAMFAPCGLELLFSKVAIKPGKPVWLGRAMGRWVLGLPGNPTSAMVTAALFLRPLLAALQGRAVIDTVGWRRLPLATPLGATGDRETFQLASWIADGLALVGGHDSGAQAELGKANWLMRRAAGSESLNAGDWVSALAF